MSPETIEFLKLILPFALTFVGNACVTVIAQVRAEERAKARLDAVEKENAALRLAVEKCAPTADLQDFRSRQEKHDLTLWTKIDGIKEDVTQMMRQLSRVEALQEVQQRSKG